MAKLISVHASSGNEGKGTSEQTSGGDPGLTCSEQLDHSDDPDELVKDDEGADPAVPDAVLDLDLSHDGEMSSEGESLPAPEYADLLDTAWLTRDVGTADLDESTVDEVGVILDLGDTADDDDAATVLEFDVGSLLTPLAPESLGPWTTRAPDAPVGRETSHAERERLGGGADESLDDEFATRALRELLLPESPLPRAIDPESAHPESAHPDSPLPDSFGDSLLRASLLPRETAETDRGDDEVGDDERFPVFEPEHDMPVSREDEAASDIELD
ncbi:MAG TPA: hypothetical protein VG963_03400 [Polyangiaceae bacterium]|nr:hypothetical protein [Polyangiaceae bacterium]